MPWISSALLLCLASGLGFSGCLLPGNELSFFTPKVGTNNASVIPGIGGP
jgi:quinol-cytochrome oxidoreductase complex cytochrome b subunit